MKYITALKYIILFIIVIAVACVIYSAQKPPGDESILQQNKTVLEACATLQEHMTVIDNSIAKIAGDYTGKIESLARRCEQVETENKALKDYINGFEDKFWKGDE